MFRGFSHCWHGMCAPEHISHACPRWENHFNILIEDLAGKGLTESTRSLLPNTDSWRVCSWALSLQNMKHISHVLDHQSKRTIHMGWHCTIVCKDMNGGERNPHIFGHISILTYFPRSMSKVARIKVKSRRSRSQGGGKSCWGIFLPNGLSGGLTRRLFHYLFKMNY